MMTTVKLKVRPDQALDFPGLCVYCARPASGWQPVARRQGRITRLLEVPLCDHCLATLKRRSYLEERWHKLGIAGPLIGALVAGVALYLLLPATLPALLRQGATAGTAVIVALFLYQLTRRLRHRAALPEKKAIREAVRIRRFSWRTMTFEFSNDTVGQQFAALHAERTLPALTSAPTNS